MASSAGKRESKRCEYCGMSYDRKRREATHDWQSRRFCSRECAHAAPLGSVPPPRTKACLNCGAMFTRPPGDGRERWLKRLYCSQTCAAHAAGRPPLPRTKVCEACGTEFHRDSKLGRAQWMARRFCSVKCAKDRRFRASGLPEDKECAVCGERFSKHPKESLMQWAARLCCSRRCGVRWSVHERPRPRVSGLCRDCGEWTDRMVKDRCRSCDAHRRYMRDRERQLAIRAAWRAANPDYWRQPRILAERREGARRWADANPERHRASARRAKRRRRARLKGVDVDTSGRTERYSDVLSADPCSYCGSPAGTIDHIDPVARGGQHGWQNLTAACRRCNSRKSDRFLLDFLLQRLLELGRP